MGNWRTVDIKGYMDKIEASELRKELSEKTEWDSPAACLRMSKSYPYNLLYQQFSNYP